MTFNDPDWRPAVLVAWHWPALTTVAVDLPEHGWARAHVGLRHREDRDGGPLVHLPVADRQAVAVTYWSQRDRAPLRVPLPKARAAHAAALTDRYATEPEQERP